LPEELQSAELLEFSLNYAKEATLGESLKLRGVLDGDTYRMEGLCGAGTCFTCACKLDI
jgi:ferredoxin